MYGPLDEFPLFIGIVLFSLESVGIVIYFYYNAIITIFFSKITKGFLQKSMLKSYRFSFISTNLINFDSLCCILKIMRFYTFFDCGKPLVQFRNNL